MLSLFALQKLYNDISSGFGIFKPSKAPYQLEQQQKNNPLHGKTLETILNELVAYYGWPELGRRIRINCFNDNPSVKSSLKFLRKTDWARKKVEDLYVSTPFNI